MFSKQNRRFKSKRFQHDYRKEWTENINKTFHANVNVNLIVENVMQIKSRTTINADVSVYICSVYIVLYLESYLHVVAKMVNI